MFAAGQARDKSAACSSAISIRSLSNADRTSLALSGWLLYSCCQSMASTRAPFPAESGQNYAVDVEQRQKDFLEAGRSGQREYQPCVRSKHELARESSAFLYFL